MTAPAVAVTGMGVKTPIGGDLRSFWTNLRLGRSAEAPITQFDTMNHPVKIACEIRYFDFAPYLPPKDAAHLDRATQLAFAAATDALEHSGELASDPSRIGVISGTGIGGISTLEREIVKYCERGAGRVNPYLVPMMMPNAPAAIIALEHGFTGPTFAVVTACAAGANAIGEAARLIRGGEVDIVIAGGSESAITPVTLGAFNRMGALSRHSDKCSRASRPFDATRDGFVMGEGAAYVVLEAWERAVARGARILGGIAGYGRTTDSYHITAPAVDGAGAVRCMELALEDAGLTPNDICHINAHGTSTPLNDAAEANAIFKVFGEAAPPVTSVKGATGHLIGAAGAVEVVASLIALSRGEIFPTANYEYPDPALPPLDVVQNYPRLVRRGPAISNSFGFGGHNASLVLTEGFV